MSSSWLLLLPFIAATLAAPALAAPGATCPYPPNAISYSQACAHTSGAGCLDSGSQAGHPAGSSVADGSTDAVSGYNFSSNAGLAIDYGFFAASSHTGGSTPISPTSSAGAGAHSEGNVYDCLTFAGYEGFGQAHLPIHVTGSSFISWTIGGEYVPADVIDPAYARLRIPCAAYSYATGTLSGCNDPDFIYDASQSIDTTIELVFQFGFGNPITLEFSPNVTTSVGVGANGSPGVLQGTANLYLEAEVLPMYVTDFSGTLMPNATVTGTSNYDWRLPVPEPGAGAAGIAALIALAVARTRPRASR